MAFENETATDPTPHPWVKPTVERVPLNVAQGGPTAPDVFDNAAGSS